MKRLKNHFLTRINALLTTLLGMLGITSCATIDPGIDWRDDEVICMYGVPQYVVNIHGRVTDKVNRPIQDGIEVQLFSADAKRDTLSLPATTDENGNYQIVCQSYPNNQYEVVKVVVKDHLEQYQSDSAVVNPQKKSDGAWLTSMSSQVDFKLKKK